MTKSGVFLNPFSVRTMIDIPFGEDGAMAKYKSYDYSQGVLIPVSLEEQLMPGTLEFAIHTLVETQIETLVFEDRYSNDETGRLAYDPKILLKGVLLGYSRGLISSRQIERACRENVTFMALTCREQPDHSTIAGFVSSMKEEVKSIFRDVLLVCEEDYFEGKNFTADSNYHSPPNLRKCEEGGLDAYIPDKRFRRRDPRFEREHKQRQRRTDRLTLADFEHHEQRDGYRCSQGRVFKLQVKGMVTDGIIYRRYLNDGDGCKGRELKARCINGKKRKPDFQNHLFR